MDLERDLSPVVDDPEPAWGDEDAAPRGSLWLARARALAVRAERSEDGPLAPAPQPAAADLAPAPEPSPFAAPQAESDDVSWFTAPEPAPGTLEAIAPADDPVVAHPDMQFPPAWFPVPEPAGAAPVEGSPEEAQAAAALSAALARFEAGGPLQADDPLAGIDDEPAVAAGDASFEATRDVHAWFPSSQAFLATLSAEAVAVRDEVPPELHAAVAVDAMPDAAVDEALAFEASAGGGDHAPVTDHEAAVAESDTGGHEAQPSGLGPAPVTDVPPFDVSPAVARWRAVQEASLEAWVATATRTIEGWPAATAPSPGADARVTTDDVRVDAGAAADPTPLAGVEPAPVSVASSDEPQSNVVEESPAAADDELPVAALAPTPEAVTVPTPAPVPAPAASPVVKARRQRRPARVAVLAAASLAGVAVVATMLVPKALVSPAPVASAVPKAAAVAQAPAKVAPVAASGLAAVPALAPAAPAWRETTEWTAGRRKSVAYEVAADRPVRLWMRQSTPVLVVRCLGGTLDAFVVTQSASAIEPGRTDHTVRLAFDDGPEAVERWTDSADHDGLFAPDGRSVLARAAGASRLRFRFMPHNAPAAEATFSLAGVDALKGPLTRHCR